MAQERLQKYLARAGVASRRASEKLIESGRIRVNGKIVRELGSSVTPSADRVEFDGREVTVDVRHVYLMVNKPQQMISAAADPEGRPVVTSLIPEDFGRVYPVGRLDWDSEGLLLLTDDGELTNLLTHPKHEVPKTYQVKVRGRYAADDSRIERIRHGTRLDDGTRTMPCEVVLDAETGQNTWYVVTIKEGKNRQIRRMFESVGILVNRLRRIAMGPLLLGDLRPGDFRRLNDGEVEELYSAAGGKRPKYSASRGRLSHGNRDSKLQMRREARRSTAPVAPPAQEAAEGPPTRKPAAGGTGARRSATDGPRARKSAADGPQARKSAAGSKARKTTADTADKRPTNTRRTSTRGASRTQEGGPGSGKASSSKPGAAGASGGKPAGGRASSGKPAASKPAGSKAGSSRAGASKSGGARGRSAGPGASKAPRGKRTKG